MDMESGKQQFITFVKKYQYVLLVVMLGAFLMLIPQRTEEPVQELATEETGKPEFERELAAILSKISGVGKTEVLLTELSSRDTIYQMDAAQGQTNRNTVIVMDRNREESGLIKQVLSPIYRGAIIICEGADSASVRLSVVEAVSSVTGLSSDCISVLKMK